MPATPILCFAPGSCARVPLIALEEIGEPYELKLIAFVAGEHRHPEYLAINPSGKVPALILPDGVLAQNTAILHYLARAHPEARLLPPARSTLHEAQLIAMLARFAADLHPIVTRIRMPQFFADVLGGSENVRTKGCEAMAVQMRGIEQQLTHSEWYLSSGWSILDAYLFWVWFRIIGAGFDTTDFPNLSRHHARIQQRPSVQRALACEAESYAELERRGLTVPLA